MRALCRRFMQSLRHLGRLLSVGTLSGLAACTGAHIIDADVSDFRNSFARAAEEQILRNILRARDQLPLHFSELQSISATIQQTANISSTAPFGPRRGSNVRDTLTASVGLQNNPQFSVGTLETQEFTKGILSPIEPKIIKQFVDRGIDPRIIFILFFSEFQGINPGNLLARGPVQTNSFPCMDFSQQRCYEPVRAYLERVREVADKVTYVNVYTVLTPVGPTVAATDAEGSRKTQFAAKDVAAIDYTKFRLVPKIFKENKESDDEYHYQLYSISTPKIAFCSDKVDKGASRFVRNLEDPECQGDEIELARPTDPKSFKVVPKFEIRSVYQMIQYLGQILAFQDYFAERDSCIVLPGKYGSCEAGGALFRVNSPKGAPAISTSYDGKQYFVVDGSCQRASPCDHSTQVLDMLTVLLNTNKVAKDIPNPAIVSVHQ